MSNINQDAVFNAAGKNGAGASVQSINHVNNLVPIVNEFTIWGNRYIPTGAIVQTSNYFLYPFTFAKSANITEIGVIPYSTSYTGTGYETKIVVYASDENTNLPTGLPIFESINIQFMDAAPHYVSLDLIIEAGKIYWFMFLTASTNVVNIVGSSSTNVKPHILNYKNITGSNSYLGCTYLSLYPRSFDSSVAVDGAFSTPNDNDYPSVFFNGVHT